MRTPLRHILPAIALVPFIQPVAAQTCENPKTHKACVQPTGKQNYTYGQQILNIRFRNTCDAKVTLEVVLADATGRLSKDRYEISPNQTKNVECNWPGKVAQYCIKSAVSLCDGSEDAHGETPKGANSKAEKDEPQQATEAARLDERQCQASAQTCQEKCRKKYLNDSGSFVKCQGSDDGCKTQFDSCVREGQWKDPAMLESSTSPAQEAQPAASSGQFDGEWYMTMHPIKNCEGKKGEDVWLNVQDSQVKKNAFNYAIISIDSSISASGEFRMVEHYSRWHGDVIYSGRLTATSGTGIYKNTGGTIYRPPYCHGKLTFRRK